MFYVKYFNHSILSQQTYTEHLFGPGELRDITKREDSTYPLGDCSLARNTDMKQGLITMLSVIK